MYQKKEALKMLKLIFAIEFFIVLCLLFDDLIVVAGLYIFPALMFLMLVVLILNEIKNIVKNIVKKY